LCDIAIGFNLVFTIPIGKLTINGLVLAPKQAPLKVMETILNTLLKAIDDIEKNPLKYYNRRYCEFFRTLVRLDKRFQN
jgi:hypothetical protein